MTSVVQAGTLLLPDGQVPPGAHLHQPTVSLRQQTKGGGGGQVAVPVLLLGSHEHVPSGVKMQRAPAPMVASHFAIVSVLNAHETLGFASQKQPLLRPLQQTAHFVASVQAFTVGFVASYVRWHSQ